MTDEVTCAMFGLGRIGQIHLGNLLGNYKIRLSWIVETNTEHATTLLKEKYAAPHINVCGFEDMQTVLDDKKYVKYLTRSTIFTIHVHTLSNALVAH